MKGLADLADLPEDDRIRVIAHLVRDHGQTVGVLVDDVPGKPERYTDKLLRAGCRVIEQAPGPVPGVITLKVRPLNVN